MNSSTHCLFKMFLRHIVKSPKIRSNSKTPVGSIYWVNLTATVSDHLPQFLNVPDTFWNQPFRKLNTFERDKSKFDEQNFIQGCPCIDWENSTGNGKMSTERGNSEILMNLIIINFLEKFGSILDIRCTTKNKKTETKRNWKSEMITR